MDREVVEVVGLLKESYGRDIARYDGAFLAKSIAKRRSANNGLSHAEYCSLLRDTPKEIDQLLDSLHIGYSEFFRNPLTFAYLEQFVLPILFACKKKKHESAIRIWSAACAAGQEAYSLAMLLDELNENIREQLNFLIFATDNDETELSKAREGVYHLTSMDHLSFKRVNTYFVKSDDSYVVSPSLRKHIDYSLFDLLDDKRSCPTPSIYGNFDLVVCSNLLFYYKTEHRRRILDKITNTLAPGGYLVTGETEREILLKYGLFEIFENSAIFKKNG